MASKRHNPTAILDQHYQGLEKSQRLATLLGVIQTLATLGFAFWVARLIDQALNNSLGDPAVLTLTLLLILTLKAVALYWQNRINLRNSVLIRDRLRQRVLDLCFRLGIELYPRFKASELSNLLTSEIDKLKDYYAEYQVQKRMSVLTPVLILIASLYVNWLVPLLLLLTTPLIPLFMILVGKRAAEASRSNLKELNRLGHLLEDRLRNIDLLQQQNALAAETERLHQQSDQFRRSTMKVLRLAFLSGTLLEFFAALSVALVAVYLGLFFLGKYDLGGWQSGLSFADGAFLLMLAPEYYLPLRKLGALYHAKSNAKAVAEQIEHLERLAKTQQNSPQSEAPEISDLQIEQLTSGSGGRPVHQPVSVSLRPGESLLIEAPSGTGKTTLLDTLAGLRPAVAGSLSSGQRPVAAFNNPGWQRQIGYISQHAELIYGSLRANLTLGQAYSDEQLWEALRIAELETTIRALPQQLDYFITDAGNFLSGGQIQRLAIARIFLHQPRLLLLDEPIANLDQETAEHFMLNLRFHTERGGLLIMASHRSSTEFQFSYRLTLEPSTETQHA